MGSQNPISLFAYEMTVPKTAASVFLDLEAEVERDGEEMDEEMRSELGA